ncbi:acyl-CoA dehydrogenase [Aeromicrobium sp. PE09-221]|uniref:phosphotransferase family protein n=1 Tax=Aeromicrobium sp. PE09-221 TaxID=1898043 RepID=UPI000B3E970C|nr:phosphotransferase family protein [Aeromicrobium sp. PE09-221]OUZ11671.1 acyl-CoA dehydrogenase [Aeromicrobium sp. PE09-221]
MTEGLDTGALARWIDAERPGVLDTSGPLTATLITGGKSNLTYRVSDGAREIIARRPPLGHVLATAHDMSREYKVMRALADTAVPVPATYGLCEDDSVIGAPFYLMESVAGTPYQRADQLSALGEERTRAISEHLVDTLAALHEVDYAAVGLEDFGRPDGYLERQVRRWKKQLEASRSREIDGIDELYARLERSIPQSGDGTIVHGDYRLDNALVDDTDHITAVLDWEMSTLGDPLTDVALMVAYQNLALHDSGASPASVTDAPKAPGYLSVDAVIDRYATTSGRDLSELGFHLGLAYFKLAVILEGIYYRYIHGQTLGEGFDHIGDSIFPLVQHGLDATT